MQEMQVQSLGWEDPLEEEMATHSSILAWEIPRTEEPGGLQPTGSQRVRHDWAHTRAEMKTRVFGKRTVLEEGNITFGVLEELSDLEQSNTGITLRVCCWHCSEFLKELGGFSEFLSPQLCKQAATCQFLRQRCSWKLVGFIGIHTSET